MANEREEVLSDLTGTESEDETGTTEDAGSDLPAGGGAAEVAAPTAGEGAAALLESISEPDPNAAPQAAVPPAAAEEAAKPEASLEPVKPKTLEEEEAEALEGVKSERGRERIQATFARLKETEGVRQQLEQDITEFKTMVQSTKMQPQEFAKMLEFGRLANSGDEDSARLALKMLDEQREALCKHLGIEAPGVDPLADFPQLKEAVDNMEMTKDHALALAKYQRKEQVQQRSEREQQAQQQDMQQYQEAIANAGRTSEAYFATRKHEVDYAPKLARIQAYFSKPENVKAFVETYQPNQWHAQFKFMYDNMSVAPAQPAKTPQPIRSRSTTHGAPVSNPNMSPEDRIMGHLESLGL